MIYNLTEKQFGILWEEENEKLMSSFSTQSSWRYKSRVSLFKTKFGNKIKYTEDFKENYWGVIEGDERHINWFILQYL